ncbi:MAG: hypothetical protein ACLR08_12510 [Dorea longicatena]
MAEGAETEEQVVFPEENGVIVYRDIIIQAASGETDILEYLGEN